MKTFWFGFIFCLLLLLIGCSADQPTPIQSSTVVIESVVTTMPTATIQATPTATGTAVPPLTPTNVSSPSPTPSLPPPPEGQIIFLWDAESPPLEYGGEPKQSLYLAQPGNSPDDWNIQPILNDLYGFPITALSPDETKLALMVLEDRDNDGAISYGSFKRGGDARNLYIYSLANGSFERTTEDFPNSYYLGWKPDSQEITFPDDLKVFSYNITTETTQLLSDSYPDKVAQVAWSPDGNPLAVKLYSGPLYFFNQETGENIQSPDELTNSPSLTVAWAPDGEWLASNTRYGAGLFVVNSETLESVEVVTTDFASSFAWSPDARQLAYAQTEFSGDTIVNTAIYLWDVATRESQVLREFEETSGLLWSLDSETLAVGAFDHDSAELTLIEINTKDSNLLLREQNETSFVPLAWSPDGTWLLFFNKQVENSGLYIVHRDGGEPYLLLNTTETYEPYAVFWLSKNISVP